MRGIELKHIGVRSFRLKGLTARWGVDGDRPPMPPELRASLVAWYNTEIQHATNFDVLVNTALTSQQTSGIALKLTPYSLKRQRASALLTRLLQGLSWRQGQRSTGRKWLLRLAACSLELQGLITATVLTPT